jgi:hypothetical protein
MEIKINIEGKGNIELKRSNLHFVELDFSMLHNLTGNKDILEQAFQELKEELR